MYKVSVIVPVYNAEKYISRCIDSILSQVGAEIEIIVINDGSTDNTLDVLNKYSDKINLITVENGGVSSARNTGLKNISGDFVMFVDSDDTLKEGAIKKLIEKQEKYNADIIRFRYEKVYSDNKTDVPKYQPDKERFISKEAFSKEVYPYFMNGITLNSVWLSFCKYELVKDLSFRTDMRVCEDAVFSLELISKAKNLLFIEDILYNYYTLEGSLTGSAVKVIRKYIDNYKFAHATVKKLREWNMLNLNNIIRCYIRPFSLTFDKIKRMKKIKDMEKSE